jgi:hypothetical protein
MCGDWNTRIANLSPNLGEESTTRRSEDTQTNQRAQWLLDICEQQGWKILNGLQPGLPACNTFRRGDDSSCIDLIMTNQPSNNITYDPTTLNSIQFNSIKVNPSISTKEPDGDSTPHAYNSHTTIIQHVKEPADILYQIHR